MASYNTAQRQKLINFLSKNPDKQFSVKQIHSELSDDSISLSAVYRNISAMEAEGTVSRYTKEGSREMVYRYTHSGECMKSIHLSCVKCGKTFHLNPEETDRIVSNVKLTDGFELNKNKTVLYGFCKNCI